MTCEGSVNKRFALFCDIVQHIVVIPYWLFGTTCRFHLHGWRILLNYHYVLCDIPEEHRSNPHCGGSL